jgi:AcrR family transcriptional regulator
MNTTRTYSMQTRAAAVEATRERILSEAQRLFLERWYDDVTIALVAREAGVSGQTVLNHFGSKELLFAAVIERISGELQGRRNRAQPGDVAGAIAILVDDYEINGDATIRLLAVAERLPVVQRAMDMGRRGHREWVQRTFATPQRLAELIVVTDVYAWKLLRRDQRLNRDETVAAMRRMVEGVLADQPPDQRT